MRRDADSVVVELNRPIDDVVPQRRAGCIGTHGIEFPDDRGAERLVIAVSQHRVENLEGLLGAIHRRLRRLFHTIAQVGVVKAGRGTPNSGDRRQRISLNRS